MPRLTFATATGFETFRKATRRDEPGRAVGGAVRGH